MHVCIYWSTYYSFSVCLVKVIKSPDKAFLSNTVSTDLRNWIKQLHTFLSPFHSQIWWNNSLKILVNRVAYFSDWHQENRLGPGLALAAGTPDRLLHPESSGLFLFGLFAFPLSTGSWIFAGSFALAGAPKRFFPWELFQGFSDSETHFSLVGTGYCCSLLGPRFPLSPS